MKTQLYIPKKIKVGYNLRDDTYTKKLAYVIYYDDKGVLRKETSWKGWIDKGNPRGLTYVQGKGQVEMPENIREPLPTHDFDNLPTEGFVLNKKVGGTKYGWNPRATYTRVYDPRGFEFEITIPNLLFILQECNCYKGKGLEGEFVYSWDGKDLVLLPVNCQEYKECQKFTTLQAGTIGVKDLIPGCSYQTKRQENLIYLGKFNWHEFKHKYEKVDGKTISKTVTSYKKQYIFIDESNKSFRPVSSLDFLAKINSDIPVSNYADLMDIFQKDKHSSPPKELKKKEIKEIDFGPEDEYKHNIGSNFFKEISPDSFDKYSIYQEKKYNHTTSKYELLGFTISKSYNITFSNKKLSYQEMDYYNHTNRYSKYYSKEEIKNIGFVELCLILENGIEVAFNNY